MCQEVCTCLYSALCNLQGNCEKVLLIERQAGSEVAGIRCLAQWLATEGSVLRYFNLFILNSWCRSMLFAEKKEDKLLGLLSLTWDKAGKKLCLVREKRSRWRKKETNVWRLIGWWPCYSKGNTKLYIKTVECSLIVFKKTSKYVWDLTVLWVKTYP